MKYNKLVHDRIPEIIRLKSGTCRTHTATFEEYGSKLKEKLQEEVQEFLDSEDAEELADILEVIEAIAIYKQISYSHILEIKHKKFNERGGFGQKIILEESSS